MSDISTFLDIYEMLLLRDFGRSLIHWGGLNVPFFNFYRTQVSLGSDLWVWFSLTHSLRLDVFMHTFDPKVRYMITIIIVAQNYPIHHQAGILSESIVFSPRRTCPESSPSSPSWFRPHPEVTFHPNLNPILAPRCQCYIHLRQFCYVQISSN